MSNKNIAFEEVGSFSLNDKKPQTALSVIFLLIAGIGTGIIFITQAYANNVVPVWTIVLSVICFIVVHELIHTVFMSVFSKGKVNVKTKFPTIAVGSDAYFSRAQYIAIALSPVAILGVASFTCLLLLPYKLLFSILLALNFATASGDYILTYYAVKQKKEYIFCRQGRKNSTLFAMRLIYKGLRGRISGESQTCTGSYEGLSDQGDQRLNYS